MAGEWVLTIGNTGQIAEAIKGDFLKGHREPRIAMVGRSNVGKSSLINALMGGRLAQTSAEPGKTRLLHFYLWKEAKKIIADLPGYGYAKASKDDRDRWAEFVKAYLDADPLLKLALVLLDSRHGPMESDAEAIRFLLDSNINVQVIFTKFDALKTQKERAARKKEAEAAIAQLGLSPDSVIWLSAKSRDQGLSRLNRELCETRLK